MPPKKEKGNFRNKMSDPTLSEFSDFENPWNFMGLMQSRDSIVHKWMRDRGLLLTQYICPDEKCHKICKITPRPKKADGETLRCGSHEYAMRKNSFFEKSHFAFQDLLHFIKCYLEGDLLSTIAKKTGMCYNTTAVEWAKYMRRIFKEYIYENVHGIENMTFSGIIEIDESLFGRKVKYNKGNPRVGLKVIIVKCYILLNTNTNIKNCYCYILLLILVML